MGRESFEGEVRALPGVLRAALEKEMRAKRKAKEIGQKIAELEEAARTRTETDEVWDSRSKEALAKAALDEAEAEAEMRVRRGAETKMTEAHVKAAVLTDPEVKRLRRAYVEAQNERRVGPVDVDDEEPESPQIQALRDQVWALEDEAAQAEVDVQVAYATIETCKMLVALATGRGQG